MVRKVFCQRVLRQIYGTIPSDDAAISVALVNTYINEAIANSVKINYKESVQFDGVAYVNNSFYTSFKSLAVTKDDGFLYKVQLPEIPVGVGKNEGISTLQFKDANNKLSQPCIPLSENQRGYYQTMRAIPNKTLYFNEGTFVYAVSTVLLNQYTCNLTMISGGDSNDLNSTLNVPDEALSMMTDYIVKLLMNERLVPKDQINSGVDNK